MNNDLNIEDFFKNSLEGHSVEPRILVWKGISKKLWMRQLGDFFKISFEGYKVTPQTNIWSSIARKLWLYNFLRFNPASFNIYYLGLAVSVITGLMVSFDFGENSEIASQKKSIVLNNNNAFTNINKNVKFNNKETVISNDKFVADNSTEAKNTVLNVPANNNNLIKNQNILPVKNNINNQIARNTHKINPPLNNTFFKGVDLNKTNEVLNDQKLTSFNTQSENETETSKNTGQKMLLSILQPRSPLLSISKATDILFPDTLGYNLFGAPIVLERAHWSVDAWWSPIYNSTLFDINDPEFIEYTGLLKNAASQDFTYSSYGGDLNYSYKNWIFQSGVSYTELGQKMRVPNTITDIRHSAYYNYFENKVVLYDTIWFLDLDSLLQGNTVLIAKPVETWTIEKDSDLVNKYDTLKTTNHHIVSNRYSYLEIPIMAGYEIRSNKFSFSIKGGIAAGFFIRSSGSMPTSNGYESVSLNNSEFPYIKPNFTILFSLGISYHLSNKIAVFGEPFIRKNLNSIFENRYIYSQKFQSVGVKVGIKYTFK